MAAQFPRVSETNGKVDYCFDVLRRIAQGSYTKWSIVYDTGNFRIHFKTKKAKKPRYVDFDELEFGNETPVLTLGLNEDLEGNIFSELEPYSYERNRAVFLQSLKETPVLSALPSFLLEHVAKYPDTMKPVAAQAADTTDAQPASVP